MDYSMISSTRASSEDGRVRPSAFAVFRLMTVSYLVGACTGRSAGFSPLKIRSLSQPAAFRCASNQLSPKTDQTTVSHEGAPGIGCRQSMSGCARDDEIAIIVNQRARHRDQPAIRIREQIPLRCAQCLCHLVHLVGSPPPWTNAQRTESPPTGQYSRSRWDL